MLTDATESKRRDFRVTDAAAVFEQFVAKERQRRQNSDDPITDLEMFNRATELVLRYLKNRQAEIKS
ncbi:hypothetical protein D5085_09640 [Ectothiorhodospiraceae bacterium BW-2]|nr:hypothetical protein D5085_09640 [Ectothiorhodospiraceae bacterium BW-2]